MFALSHFIDLLWLLESPEHTVCVALQHFQSTMDPKEKSLTGISLTGCVLRALVQIWVLLCSYCPEAIEYSSQQFRIYPPCLWLFGHWPLFFLCLPPSLVGQKKKKRSEKRKSDTVLLWIIRPTKLSPWLAVEFVSHPSFQTWRWQLSSVSSRCQVIRIIPWGVSLHPLELLCFWCPEPFKAEGVFLLPGCNYEVLLRFCRFYLQVPDSFTTQPVSVK